MGTLRIVDAKQRNADGELYLAVTLVNETDAAVEPGGLRMIVARSSGASTGLSISNHWRLGPGAEVYLTAFLPRWDVKHVDFVDYRGFDGAVYPIGDRLSMGWFSNDLRRGATGDDARA